MFTKEYWNTRAKKYGHTGHAEPFYYCFDQQARLYAINELIEKISSYGMKKNSALDFGCGSGDFIPLLDTYFKTICGFDISETVVNQTKKRFDQPGIFISDNYNDVILKQPFDLILTITVLQNLGKQNLETIIKLLNESLGKDGYIISMEFFSNADINSKLNESKATTEDWKNLLVENNLKIISSLNFYNPIVEPSKSWYYYNTNLYLKVLKPFKHSRLVQNKFIQVSKKLINQYKDILPDKESNFKIYIIQKENSCN